jgi:hypothetical protein
MPMDAHLSGPQPAEVYNRQRAAMVNQYTNIPGNAGYHYSWQAGNTIVVGVGGGPGNHRNFTCNITNRMVITLAQGGGGLAVGPGGINAANLQSSVERALKLRFRALIQTAAFNDLGRAPQQLTFLNNQVTNRLDKSIRIGATVIQAGANHTFAAGTMNGFVVVQNLPGDDTYYRNFDVRGNMAAGNGEAFRLTSGPIKFAGVVSGDVTIVEL